MLRTILGLTTAALIASVSFAADTKYTLSENNTKVEFTGTKANGKHDGGFKKVTGAITAGAEIKIEVEIDIESLYSDDPKLTNHLKSPDFFNAKANPKAKFVSTKVEKDGDMYKVTGDLTLVGKTKSITFPAKITTGDEMTLSSSFKFNRHEYGITYGKGKIDDEVALKIEVKAKK